MKCTILGARGFIGSHLAAHLSAGGHECFLPDRDDPRVLRDALGHVFYCIGVTADFRHRAFDTARAHVGVLTDVLERGRFDSLLYLSSTRVYARATGSGEEEVLGVLPTDRSDYYNLTKLTGESLCFASERVDVRVARLSNVFGTDFGSENFLTTVVKGAVDEGSVFLETSLDSEKDYVSIRDVVGILPRIAFSGRARIYNVAAGRNTSNAALLHALSKATNCNFTTRAGAPTIRFPAIDVARLKEEFGYTPSSVLSELDDLVERYRGSKRDNH